MGYVLTNLPFFLLLVGGLVIVHELGHFLVARACGVRVLRFSIGFGPSLLQVRRGATEYRVGLLPLGGYVKMLGDSTDGELAAADAPFAFSTRPAWQRTAIVLAGPLANFLLAALVYTVLLSGSHWVNGTRMGIVMEDQPAWRAGLRPGDQVTAVDGVPVTAWDALRKAVAARPDGLLTLRFRRGEEAAERQIELRPEAHAEENMFQEQEARGRIGISCQYVLPMLALVDPESPAAMAGLQDGDQVLQVGERPVQAWHELRAAVQATPAGAPVRLRIRRGEEVLTRQLLPGTAPTGLDSLLASAADGAAGAAAYTGLVARDVVVQRVEAATPAATAGLRVGDRLLTLTQDQADGPAITRPIGVWSLDLAAGLDARLPLRLTWQRGRAIMTAPVQLTERAAADEFNNSYQAIVFGAFNDPAQLGSYQVEERRSPWGALVAGVGQVGQDIGLMGQVLRRLFVGRLPMNSVGGPIMLFVVAEKTAKRGASTFARAMAFISVNLGVMNLLPIPTLDGGHLMFYALEAVSRRQLSWRLREAANLVGLVLLLLLMALSFRNDVLRFIVGS